MSAIFGIFHLDREPVDPARLNEMALALNHRGREATGIRHSCEVGLGHCMSYTTPESRHECYPLSATQNDAVMLTADARIDNRDELIENLNIDCQGSDNMVVTDGKVILEAYLKWGEDCPRYLVGAFAFAIWDGRTKRLFCARDHFGLKPFYYCQTDRSFVFGSEIKALWSGADLTRRVNELHVGYHLAAVVEDKSITAYQGIWRLPPAHWLAISAETSHRQMYWALDASRELKLQSEQEYTDAFLDILREAVRCRLRALSPIGTMLSGGLDSSSVTCLAYELMANSCGRPIHAVSAIFEKTQKCDERLYVHATVQNKEIRSHYVDIDALNPLGEVNDLLWHLDEPFVSPTYYIAWHMCRAAKEAGVGVLLTGLDGDTAIGHGDGYLAALARSGQWQRFASETKALAKHENSPSASLLFQVYGLPYLSELAEHWRWLLLIKQVDSLSYHLPVSRLKLVRHIMTQTWTARAKCIRGYFTTNDTYPRWSPSGVIKHDFARRIDLGDHIRVSMAERLRAPKTERQEQYALLSSGLQTHVFELMERISSAFGIESRHPFADRRLLEFCLALPPEQKLQNGWTRIVLRRAMAGIVPDQIRWRGGKAVNSAAVTQGIQLFARGTIEEIILHDPSHLETYVNIDTLRTTYQRYLTYGYTDDEMVVWQAVILALWLRHAQV